MRVFHLKLHDCVWWLAKKNSPVQKYKRHLLSKETIRIYDAHLKWGGTSFRNITDAP